jgi:ribosomal protein L20
MKIKLCKAPRECTFLRKTKKREFKQAILDKLEHLQSNNPKEYWKLINMLKEKS